MALIGTAGLIREGGHDVCVADVDSVQCPTSSDRPTGRKAANPPEASTGPTYSSHHQFRTAKLSLE